MTDLNGTELVPGADLSAQITFEVTPPIAAPPAAALVRELGLYEFAFNATLAGTYLLQVLAPPRPRTLLRRANTVLVGCTSLPPLAAARDIL